jgi:hypothetical protein
VIYLSFVGFLFAFYRFFAYCTQSESFRGWYRETLRLIAFLEGASLFLPKTVYGLLIWLMTLITTTLLKALSLAPVAYSLISPSHISSIGHDDNLSDGKKPNLHVTRTLNSILHAQMTNIVILV